MATECTHNEKTEDLVKSKETSCYAVNIYCIDIFNQITASIFIVSHHIVLLTYMSGIENNFLCYKSILIIYHQHLYLAIHADLFLTIIDIS